MRLRNQTVSYEEPVDDTHWQDVTITRQVTDIEIREDFCDPPLTAWEAAGRVRFDNHVYTGEEHWVYKTVHTLYGREPRPDEIDGRWQLGPVTGGVDRWGY